MKFLDIFSSDQFVRALGWTILHSVWQIAIVASLLSILLIFMKKSSSRIRYFTACVAMLLVVAISVTTFTVEYSNYQESIKISQDFGLSPIELDFANAVIQESNEACRTTFFNGFENYFEQNIPLIVLIWNLVVLVLLLKTISGFAYSQRIKSYQTNAMPTHWEAMLFQLTKKLGIKKRVGILESAIIKAPIVAGYFKPMILMPLGVVSGLSAEQVEAILAHELAHIKRNDYLVNIFQSIIEVLFFYHPALWWISKNIRYERENACDDIALKANISRKALATALTNLEVLNHEKLSLALAFSSKKTSLLNRIKRILNPQKTKITMKEGFITICIALASFSIVSFSMVSIISSNENSNEKFTYKAKQISTSKQNKVKERKAYNLQSPIIVEDKKEGHFFSVEDTIITINHRDNVIYEINGVKYQLDFDEDAKPEKFSVKGKEVPKEEWKNYDKIINQAEAYFSFVNDDFKKQQFTLQKQKTELEKQKGSANSPKGGACSPENEN